MNCRGIAIKQSRFNIYYEADDGTKLAFNSLTCGLAIVDDTYNSLMQNLGGLTSENVPSELRETYKAAKDGRFIIDDDFDELLDLSTKRHLQQYSMDSLGLTVAPTLACNFKCTYCYETSKPGIMAESIQEKIIEFVRKQAANLKRLHISWYGGEPLLATNVIYNLSEKFIDICEKNNLTYDASIVSNGSLLTDEIIDKMFQYKINTIQITIDGPPEMHDKRRVNKKGESTFDTIITNMNKILATDKIMLAIRINVDKTNETQIDSLIDILAKRLFNKKVKISFGQVTPYTEVCKSIESDCFDNGEFATRLIKYYDVLKKHGFAETNKLPYPHTRYNYCCADRLNSFVVDHEGYLYKCWNVIGDISKSLGNICDTDLDISSYKNGNWISRNPIYDEKCSNCELLPVCIGGCPHAAVVLKQQNKCDLVKYNIKDVMLNYYNNFQEE